MKDIELIRLKEKIKHYEDKLNDKNRDESIDTGGQIKSRNEDHGSSEETVSGFIGNPIQSYENIKPKQNSPFPKIPITPKPPKLKLIVAGK